ncbi:velvet factor [Globomyces pollinis-pini]|nr:velvet factor [Globomyces pollinis-pini]
MYGIEPKIVQQPVRGRMCGTKTIPDKRRIEPSLIIQLEFSNNTEESEALLASDRYLCHLTLVSSELNISKMFAKLDVAGETVIQNTTIGTEMICGSVLKDPVNLEKHIYFVFPNLSVRYAGVYRFCCSIVSLDSGTCRQVTTDPFQVHSSETYPGSIERTALEISFHKQGVLMSGRFKSKRKSK